MRTSVRVISPGFELLGEIDDYESLIFVRKHYFVGEFELYINIEKEHTEKLVKDNLIWIGNNNKKVGVIRHREIKLTEEGTEQLFIKGYTLKGVLGRRIIVPPNGSAYDNVVGSQEYIMKQFVDNNFVNPTDISRKIPQIYINSNQNRGNQDKWRGRFETVSDKLTEIGIYSELGWDVWLDTGNKRWVFDVVEGRNLTASQKSLPPVLFSVDFDNIKGQSFIDSSLKHSNVGYAGGKGEEENRLIQQIGKEQGLSRIESFIDCSNADNIEEINEEGQRKLKELKRILTFESEVIDFNSFVYGKDWDLGDTATIQNKKWNVTMDAQIVEVREIYDINGFNIEPVFGDDIPTFIDEIKEIKTKQNLNESSGTEGSPGKDLEYSWDGTNLGVKKENETEYEYVNLQGKQGPRGERGLPGTTNYPDLEYKPRIESIELVGNKSFEELGITSINSNEISNLL